MIIIKAGRLKQYFNDKIFRGNDVECVRFIFFTVIPESVLLYLRKNDSNANGTAGEPKACGGLVSPAPSPIHDQRCGGRTTAPNRARINHGQPSGFQASVLRRALLKHSIKHYYY